MSGRCDPPSDFNTDLLMQLKPSKPEKQFEKKILKDF